MGEGGSWERYGDIIRDLYIHRGQTLRRVMEVLDREYGFKATYASLRLSLSSLSYGTLTVRRPFLDWFSL